MRMPQLSLPPPAVQPLLMEGEALGVWRVRAALYRSDGGGQWYRARHALDVDRYAAVLVLPRGERGAGVMLRYGDLASELDQLKHPCIAVPTDSGITAGGQPYLILDWAGGKPLTMARGKLSLRERLDVLLQLCEALRHAHQQGWLLSEVDPSLLWVGTDRRLTLMGLGLVRMPDPDDPFERGMSPGTTQGYVSPEMQMGLPPSLSSEVYGLGALLCMLVDGRLPCELGNSFEDASMASAWPALSPLERLSLDALIHKAASPLQAMRHVSAEALADDLRAWLAGNSHSALTVTPMPVIAPSTEPAPVAAAAARPARVASFQSSQLSQPLQAAQEPAEPLTVDSSVQPLRAPRHGVRLAVAALAMASLAAGGWAARKQILPEPQAQVQVRPALARPPAPEPSATAASAPESTG